MTKPETPEAIDIDGAGWRLNDAGEPSYQFYACFTNGNCAQHAAGAPHRCEIGRCQKYLDALALWRSQRGTETRRP